MKYSDEIKQEFIDLLLADGYQLLSDYVNVSTKVKVWCGVEGHEPYWATPASFRRNHRCKKCRGLDWNDAKQELIDCVTSAGYKLLSDYINSGSKVEVWCGVEGHEPYKVAAVSFKRGSRCPRCMGVSNSAAADKFIDSVRAAGYKLFTMYTNSRTKVLVSCGVDGHEPTWMFSSEWRRGRRCRLCKKAGRK